MRRAPGRRSSAQVPMRSCSRVERSATRGCSPSSSTAANGRRPAMRSSASSTGRSNAQSSTWASRARRATCASSIRGTSRGCSWTRRTPSGCSRRSRKQVRWRSCDPRCSRCARSPRWRSEPLARVVGASLYCCTRRGRLPRNFALSGGAVRSLVGQPQPAIEGHMPKDVILTPEGLKKLKDELEVLSTEKRREVAERIKEAREFGDISENSEYDDAKNEQAMLESRIAQLQEKVP